MHNRDQIFKSIFKASSLSLLIRISGVLLTVGAYALLARAMSLYEYGLAAYIFNIIPLFAIVTQLGFQSSNLRFIHEYENDEAHKKGFTIFAFSCVAICGVGAFLISQIILFFAESNLPITFSAFLRYGFWIIIFFSILTLAQQILRTCKKIFLSQIFEQVFVPLTLIIFAGYFLFNKISPSVLCVTKIYGISFVIAAIAASFFAVKFLDLKKNIKPNFQKDLWLKTSTTMCLAILAITLITRMDVLLLGFFASPQDVGIYAAVSRIAGLMIFIHMAISAYTEPHISQLYQQKKFSEIEALLKKIIQIIFVLSIVALVFLALAGEYILMIFGEEFIIAKNILLILSFGHLFNLAATPAFALLNISGNQNAVTKLFLCVAAAQFILLILAIQNFGNLGAAITTSTFIIISNIFLGALIYKKTKIKLW